MRVNDFATTWLVTFVSVNAVGRKTRIRYYYENRTDAKKMIRILKTIKAATKVNLHPVKYLYLKYSGL